MILRSEVEIVPNPLGFLLKETRREGTREISELGNENEGVVRGIRVWRAAEAISMAGGILGFSMAFWDF